MRVGAKLKPVTSTSFSHFPIFSHWFFCFYIHIYICIIFPCLSFIQRQKKKLLEKSLVTAGEGAMRRESLRRDSEQCTCLDLISWLQANCRNQSVPVHTNAFSFETAYNSMRSGVPSTLKCAEGFHRKRIDLITLLKVDQNENAYISYQCGRSKTYQNENDDVICTTWVVNIAGTCVYNVHIVFNLRNNVQIYRFRTF